MRLRIDTSEVKFRVAAIAQPRARSRTDQTQKTMPDGCCPALKMPTKEAFAMPMW